MIFYPESAVERVSRERLGEKGRSKQRPYNHDQPASGCPILGPGTRRNRLGQWRMKK